MAPDNAYIEVSEAGWANPGMLQVRRGVIGAGAGALALVPMNACEALEAELDSLLAGRWKRSQADLLHLQAARPRQTLPRDPARMHA